jgi:capsular exopolysaccharide synthesis family protein
MNLGLSNRIGLSDLILGRLPMEEIVQHSEDDDNLHVITSGSLPPNPAELLASEKMNKIIKKFRSQYDMILIDTSPAIVTDAQILASKADGVIYVIRLGKTRSVTPRTPLEEFERVDANMIGVVMNRITRNRSYYYGGFDYYAPNASISDKYYRSGTNS